MSGLKKVLAFLKRIVLSTMFLGVLAVLVLFGCMYYLNSWRISGDKAVTSAVPAIVAEQLSDPAVVESFRGEQGPQGPDGPQGPVGLTGEEGVPGPKGEDGVCPNCATSTATATATPAPAPDPATTATTTLASATPQILVYQPVTVNGRGTPAGKIPTGGGWTITNNGTAIIAPVTVN
ncbi:MAG: hypothetical protein AAB575_04880 [Patescibacteria group bacterium]